MNEILGECAICCFGNCGLIVLYKNCNLKIWQINNALDMKFVRSLYIPANTSNNLLEWGNLQMDDEYIAVSINSELSRAEDKRWCTIHFVSTKTLQIERSLSFSRKFHSFPRYERGFLVVPLTDSYR